MAANNPTQGDAIETLFIDLSVRTERLENDVKQALGKIENALKDGVDKPLKDTEKRIIGMGDVFKSVAQSMVTTFAQTHNPIAAFTNGIMSANVAVQAAAASGNTAAASMAGLIGGLAGLVTVGTVLLSVLGPVVNYFKQMAEQGLQIAARVDALRVGLEVTAKNAGMGVEYVSKKVQDLQRTGITTRESIESIMQFLTQGLPIENIEKLARAGQDMAVAYGRNSTETFNRFVYAIVTGNAEVLRLVGINKTATMMQDEFAKSLGKTTEQLTQQERKQAIINGIMKAAEGYAGLYEKSLESVGKKMTSLQRYTEEAGLALGQVLLPILTANIDVATQFFKSIQAVFLVMEKGAPAIRAGKPVFTEFGKVVFDAAKDIGDLILKLIDVIKYIQSLFSNLEKTSGSFKAAGIAAKAFYDLLAKFVEVLGTFAVLRGDVERLQYAFGMLSAAFEVIKEVAVLAFTAVAISIQYATDMLENFNRALKRETLLTLEEMSARARAAGGVMAGTLLGVGKTGFEDTSREEAIADMRANNAELAAILAQRELLATEANDALKKAMAEAIKAGVGLIQAGGIAINEFEGKFRDQMTKFEADVVAAGKQLSASLQKAIIGVTEAVAKRRVELEKNYQASLAELQKNATEARLQEDKNYQENEFNSKREFLIRMYRLEEDYTLNLLDAVQERDAKRVLQLMRQHSVDVRRNIEDFSFERVKAKEVHASRLNEIDKQEVEKRQLINESYNKSLRDLDDAAVEQIKALQKSYQEQFAALQDSANKQRAALKLAHDLELAQLRTLNLAKLREMVRSWADQGVITADGASKILKILTAYYGLGGAIDTLMSSFNARMKLNATISTQVSTVENQYSGTYMTPQKSTKSPGGVPYYAEGGFAIADRPTNVMMGEGGRREAALFMPLNTNMGLDEFFKAMSSQTSGQAGGHQIVDMNIRLTADSEFSPAFEDRIMMSIASAVRDTTRTVTRVR